MHLNSKWLKLSKAQATRSNRELQTTSQLDRLALVKSVVKKRKVSQCF